MEKKIFKRLILCFAVLLFLSFYIFMLINMLAFQPTYEYKLFYLENKTIYWGGDGALNLKSGKTLDFTNNNIEAFKDLVHSDGTENLSLHYAGTGFKVMPDCLTAESSGKIYFSIDRDSISSAVFLISIDYKSINIYLNDNILSFTEISGGLLEIKADLIETENCLTFVNLSEDKMSLRKIIFNAEE